jgi:hypothetical protein
MCGGCLRKPYSDNGRSAMYGGTLAEQNGDCKKAFKASNAKKSERKPLILLLIISN